MGRYDGIYCLERGTPDPRPQSRWLWLWQWMSNSSRGDRELGHDDERREPRWVGLELTVLRQHGPEDSTTDGDGSGSGSGSG